MSRADRNPWLAKMIVTSLIDAVFCFHLPSSLREDDQNVKCQWMEVMASLDQVS